jgi:hypothetical protein
MALVAGSPGAALLSDNPASPPARSEIDMKRSQEFGKCIERYPGQNVCHVIRDHPENERPIAGPPRGRTRSAARVELRARGWSAVPAQDRGQISAISRTRHYKDKS